MKVSIFSALSAPCGLLAVLLLAAACGGAAQSPGVATPTAQPLALSQATTQPPLPTAAPPATPAPASPEPSATSAPTAGPMPSATSAPSATTVPSATSAPPTVPPTATQPPPTSAPSPPPPTQVPGAAAPTPTPQPAASAAKPGSPQEAFIAQIAPLAQAEQADSGVPASFSIALAAAETSWGISPLMKQYSNYHMVSCSKPNEGLPCVAYGNGLWNQYSSPQQAFLWHGRWMRANSGFAEAFKHTDDVATFARLAAQCYVNCSGPFPQRFYDAIMKIIDDYQLRQYDAQPAKQ